MTAAAEDRPYQGGSIRKGPAKPIDFDGCLFNAETDAARFQNINSQMDYAGDDNLEQPLDLTPNMFVRDGIDGKAHSFSNPSTY